MSLSRQQLVAILAIVVGLAGLLGVSPVLRAKVEARSAGWFGWTAEARQHDPIGFSRYVEQRLNSDLEQLRSNRREMASSVGDLNKKIGEFDHLATQAKQFAEQFRSAHQAASTRGGYPVTVRNASYTEAQLVDQVSLLLAETTGYEKTLSKMRGVQRQAAEKLEKLSVQIDSTESQLAMLSTQRELLRTRELKADNEKLVAQLDALFDANNQAVAGNPVRNVRELLAASSGSAQEQPSLAAAREFLAAQPIDSKPSDGKAEDTKGDQEKPSDPKVTATGNQADETATTQQSTSQSDVEVSTPVAKPIFSQF